MNEDEDYQTLDSRFLQTKSIQESKRQYLTAGLSSGAQVEAVQTLQRLARELAALSYVGNSSYSKLADRRTQILKELCDTYA